MMMLLLLLLGDDSWIREAPLLSPFGCTLDAQSHKHKVRVGGRKGKRDFRWVWEGSRMVM